MTDAIKMGLLSLLLLGGCARYVAPDRPVTEGEVPAAAGEDEASAGEAAPPQERIAPRHRDEAPPLPPAARALLAQAENARRAGELPVALSRAERAQRIAPDAPEVYLVLARLNLEAGSPRRAEQLARKAAQLAGTSGPLVREAKALIRRARAGR